MFQGVDFLHKFEPQIFHRDIKSANLLIDEDWTLKLADMGLARFATIHNQQTMNKICGTFAYLAPEVYLGKSFSDKSDIYSCGIVLWELANRVMKEKYEAPYSEYPFLTLDFQIAVQAAENYLRPTLDEKSCPKDWYKFYKSCISPKPANRPTATEALQQLTRMISKEEFQH